MMFRYLLSVVVDRMLGCLGSLHAKKVYRQMIEHVSLGLVE